MAGRSAHFTRNDVQNVMRAVVRSDGHALLGLSPFADLTFDHTAAAAALIFGWHGDGPRARIDPARTVDGFNAACTRVLEVARGGGRLAFATGRPASLLGLHHALAEAAAAAGGDVLSAVQSAPIDGRGHRIWWIDGVAIVSDGVNLLADHSSAAAEEWLFVLPRPDLVVADHRFAGTAAAVGLELVAFADLDAVALAVASWRGMAVRVAPLDEHCAPHDYEALLEVLDEAIAAPVPDLLAPQLTLSADHRKPPSGP